MSEEIKVNPATRMDYVGRTGIYPMSGPWPKGNAPIRGQAELGHPEQRRRRIRIGTGAMPLAMGRALLGGFFLYNGINNLRQRRTIAGYAKSKNVPAPQVAVIGSGILAIAGGLSLLTGTRPKLGASMIAAFLLGVTPRIHDFWNVEDQQQRSAELINFTRNLAILGGACFAAAVPEPWPGSWASRRRDRMVTSYTETYALVRVSAD